MLIKEIENFKKGLINSIEADSLPYGAYSAMNNWLTKGDKIELRRGSIILGTEVSGSGKITGLGIGFQKDGTEVLYKTYDRKILYYDTDSEDWIEIGTNTLPVAASGEDISFASYQSLAGHQLWLSSENSSLYKIMTANKGSIADMSSTTYRGKIAIRYNRMWLWGRRDDKLGVYGSNVDDVEGNATDVTGESIGVAGSLNYTGTLSFKAGGVKRTCFAVSFTDGVETFTDNYDGTLTGSAAGSGTINYTTGGYSITFNSVAAGAVTADYSYEDSSSGGVADFSYGSPRTNGEGFVLDQSDGGNLQTIFPIDEIQYCLHTKKTWMINLTADDTDATNQIFREKVGIPYWRAACPSGEGIYAIDDTDEEDTKIVLIRYAEGSEKLEPKKISENINLNDYRFDYGTTIEWGDYVMFACRHKSKSYNDTIFAYNKRYGSFDKLDYRVSCFAIYNGTLVAGDSISNNVYTLFSGLDDEESVISNYVETELSDLDIKRLKKCKKLGIQGQIGKQQKIKVSISLDNSAFVKVGEIDGGGSYVDRSQAINVGAYTLGRGEVGGGGSDDNIPAYNYEREFSFNIDKFSQIKLKFEGLKIGYASVSKYIYKDIRQKQMRLPKKYRT